MKSPNEDQNKRNRRTFSKIAAAIALIIIILTNGRVISIDWGTGWLRTSITVVSSIFFLWVILSGFRRDKND
jgi:hypothetical protein